MAGLVPVLGIPVINRPDLLRECLASIDIPVRLVVIDNSGTGELGDVAAEVRPDAIVAEPIANLGYTASVNAFIRAYPNEPYWLVSNADVVYGPGELQRLCDEPGGWVGVNGDWRVFKLARSTVDRVGLWDESFFNYCSDADYERRCTLAGIDWHFIDGATTHVGSVVIRSEAKYAQANTRSYPVERAYYASKWGGELRGGERYATPFDRGGALADWTMDLGAARAWNGDPGR